MFSMNDKLRKWLWSLFDWVASKEMLNALETREQQRHADQMGMLNRIEQRMINTHVGDPRDFAVPVLDWDTVQAIALHEMEKNPPKEK